MRRPSDRSSPVSEASTWASKEPGGNADGRLRTTRTAPVSSPSTGPMSPDTETSAASTGPASNPLTSSAEGSPVSLSALPESGAEIATSAGYGPSTHELSPLSGLPLFSSKTCQDCARSDCATCWPILPASGSMRSGQLRAHPTSARRTFGRASSWLPTPTPQAYGSNQGGSAGRTGKLRMGLDSLAKHGLLPTPTAADGDRASTTFMRGNPTLLGALLPTLRSTDADHGGRITPRKSREGGNLIEALSARLTIPTPRSDGGNNAGGSNARKAALIRGTYLSGCLNPSFVEWMLGFPIGWTACAPSEIASSPKSPSGSDAS